MPVMDEQDWETEEFRMRRRVLRFRLLAALVALLVLIALLIVLR